MPSAPIAAGPEDERLMVARVGDHLVRAGEDDQPDEHGDHRRHRAHRRERLAHENAARRGRATSAGAASAVPARSTDRRPRAASTCRRRGSRPGRLRGSARPAPGTSSSPRSRMPPSPPPPPAGAAPERRSPSTGPATSPRWRGRWARRRCRGPSHWTGSRGPASSGLSNWVVSFAHSRTTAIIAATRGRRRTRATSTGSAARKTYCLGSHSAR